MRYLTERAVLLVLIILLARGCGKWGQRYVYEIPEIADDGWQVDSLKNTTLSQASLEDMIDHIQSVNDHQIHSILIIKDNKLVFEKYFEGYLYRNNPPGSNGAFITYDRKTDHYLASVTKSVTSVLFGIAVKEGYIETVDEPLRDVFPEYSDILVGDKEGITLEHMLCMSSGLSWDEWSSSFTSPTNDLYSLFHADDPLEAILSNDMIALPGEEFHYNSGGTNILGAVIERKSGMRLIDFANQYLFDPLEVQGGQWETMAGGYLFASGGLYLRPRELAKIGSLFLNEGYWGDKKFITKDWIAASIEPAIVTDDLISESDAYGYQWWTMDFQANGRTYDCFFAAGWGDQYMFVFPGQEMIVVVNSGNFHSYGGVSPFEMVEDYILQQ